MKHRAFLLVFALLLVLLSSGSVSAWYEDYGYREQINITDLSGDLVNLEINTTEIYDAGKLKSNCGDIRFTDENDTELYAWDETCITNDDSKKSLFWINISTVSSGSIYMYYGNAGASSSFNGNETFWFFEDWLGTSLDTNKWTRYGAGTLTIGNSQTNYSGVTGAQNGNGDVLESIAVFSNNTIYRSNYYMDNDGAHGGVIGLGAYTYTDTTHMALLMDRSGGDNNIRFSVSNADADPSITNFNDLGRPWTTDWGVLDIRWNSTAVKFDLLADDGSPHYTNTATTTLPKSSMKLRFGGSKYNLDAAFSIKSRFIFVGDLTSVDSSYTIGAEESKPSGNVPSVTAHSTSPSTVYTNTDFKFNMTATDSDNATINAYVQFYVNGTASGATQSQSIANNTNTLIGTLSSSDFGTGAELIAEYWASDGTNSTTKANQSTVTVQAPSFSISINSPADDAQTNNNTPGFSFTVSGSSDTYSCSLFLNDSSYGTNSSTLDSTATTIIASTIPDGIYNWYVNCTSDVTTNQSETRTIRIDVEAPAITDNFINNSVYLQNTITGQFNFTDNILLHSLNISIDDSAIYTNESIDATFLQYDLSINPATLSNGVHELFIRIADGHTAIQLKSPDAYNPSNGIFNNYARYSIRKPYPALDITMYLKDQSVFDSWEITKKSDRYGETLRPSKPLTTQIFIVESDQYIHIVNDPKGNYKGQWLIIGDHWKDFVLHGEENSKVKITRITNNKVEVTISGIKNTEELTFDSTGDLNIVTKTYNFYVSNSSIDSPAYSFETDYQTITFEINKTGNVSTNAELYWNSTFKESTKTSYTNYDKYTAVFRTPFITNQEENITSYWDYNVTDGSTESNNITFNQTAYRMSIDTCSEYTAKAINFTFMDEILNEPLTIDGEIHAAMQISRSNVSDYRTTNLDYTGSNNYSLCIYPSWANYTIDFTNFEYMADEYSNREYSTSAFEISNATQEIKLYLINLSDSTNVIMSLRDSNDDVLEGYNIRVKRYYPATGEEVTSEISRTDYNGQAIARLVLYNYYYSFSIEELDGTVIKLISPSKIYSEFLTFVVDVEEEELNFEDKVWYSISPDSPVQSQPVNFSFITISPGLYIEWFAIETRFNSTDYLDNSTDADGGTVTIELDLTNQTGWLSITYYIQAANETLLTFERGYFVTDIVPGDYSIEGQREGWEDIFGVMWRVVVAVLVSIIAVLLLVPFIGPESAGVVGVLSQIGFTIMGWIPLWMIIVEAVILIGLYLMSNRGQV